MRIERINENSIRCILTSFDLSIRNLNIRELAYGSEKAKKLFNEMMATANKEVGFNAENTPIMIEAIPMGGDSIQLVITKVEDPEELDTRFSKFSQSQLPAQKSAEDWIRKLTSDILEGAGGLLSQIQQQAKASRTDAEQPKDDSAQKAAAAEPASFRAFAFDGLDRIIDAVKITQDFCGCSDLYKRPGESFYVLIVYSAGTALEDFAKTCNIIAEYGRMLRTAEGADTYYKEHYQLISKKYAIQKLGKI